MLPVSEKKSASPFTLSAIGLSLMLSFQGATASAGEGPEFNANFTLPSPFGGKGVEITIPVDCDLLDENNQQTLDFVRQFDIWGHLEHERDIVRAENHLRTHGISSDRLDKVQQYCIDNF